MQGIISSVGNLESGGGGGGTTLAKLNRLYSYYGFYGGIVIEVPKDTTPENYTEYFSTGDIPRVYSFSSSSEGKPWLAKISKDTYYHPTFYSNPIYCNSTHKPSVLGNFAYIFGDSSAPVGERFIKYNLTNGTSSIITPPTGLTAESTTKVVNCAGENSLYLLRPGTNATYRIEEYDPQQDAYTDLGDITLADRYTLYDIVYHDGYLYTMGSKYNSSTSKVVPELGKINLTNMEFTSISTLYGEAYSIYNAGITLSKINNEYIVLPFYSTSSGSSVYLYVYRYNLTTEIITYTSSANYIFVIGDVVSECIYFISQNAFTIYRDFGEEITPAFSQETNKLNNYIKSNCFVYNGNLYIAAQINSTNLTFGPKEYMYLKCETGPGLILDPDRLSIKYVPELII